MINISPSQLKGQELAEGGEAVIYKYNSGQVAKIYKSAPDSGKEDKISKLASMKLPDGVVGPTDIIRNNGRFVGYLMNKVQGEEFKKLCSKKYLKLNNITVKDISKMLFKLMEILKELHSQDIVIGDLNECNILFDKKFNISIIDVDSWSIGKYKCEVAMESFQDPKMKGTNFTKETDWYAFTIMVFKCLTMLHPFGGNMTPDIPILDRMKKGFSVIDNKNVKIPKPLCKNWNFMSPDLLSDMKKIFNKGDRFSIEKSFTNFCDNLVLCKSHKDYYYGRYDKCPVCNDDAEIVDVTVAQHAQHVQKVKPITSTSKPKQTAVTGGVPYATIFELDDIKVMLDENVYVDQNDVLHFRDKKESYSYNNHIRYYSYMDTTVVTNQSQIAINDGANINRFDKLIGSRVVIRDKSLFYINSNNVLTELQYTKNGNALTPIQHLSFKNYYEIYDRSHYLIINVYDKIKIICVDGFNHEIQMDYNINNYGIHFDPITNQWFVIIEDTKGCYHTKVFKQNKIVYESEKLKLNCDLGDICHYNSVLYIPKNGAIRGFNYLKNEYKDFQCSIVDEDAKLIKTGPKFKLIKDSGVYEIG